MNELQRSFYKEDFTAWMVNAQEAQVELESIEAAQKAADDDLVQELLRSN